MKRNLTLIALVALATGLVAVGCGDDDGGDDTSTSEALTKEEFLAQGNAICKQGNAEIGQAGEGVQGPPGTPEFDAFVTDTLVPNIQGQIDDLRALGIPEADADQVNAMLDDVQDVVDQIEADPGFATESKQDPLDPVTESLVAYGLTECNNND
jgi:hypothetical protein